MGITERRARERAELEEKILDAARSLFVEQGYEAVTLRRIAHEIEYAPSLIYSYFKDKDTLMRTLCERDFTAFAGVLAEAQAIADPIARIERIGQLYIDFAVLHPNQYKLMFMTPHPVEPSDEQMNLRGDPHRDGYAALKIAIEQAISGGHLRPEYDDVELVAQSLWAGVHGVASLHIVLGDDPWTDWREIKTRATAMTDILMRGLVARPA